MKRMQFTCWIWVWLVLITCVPSSSTIAQNVAFEYDREVEKTTVYFTAFEKEVTSLLQLPDKDFRVFRQCLGTSYPSLNIVMFLSSGFSDFNWHRMSERIYQQERLLHTISLLGPKEVEFGGANIEISFSINGKVVGLTRLFLRYVYDLLSVENEFIDRSSSRSLHNFAGMRVLEIGGGYGAFASVFAETHSLQSYTIVDLDSILLLQQKFLVSRCSSLSCVSSSHMPTKFQFISPTAAVPIPSDLLYSFLALDEIPKKVLLSYLALYVAHADRGYLVLCSSLSLVKELFDRIALLQPTARLLFMDDLYGTLCDRSYFALRLLWDATPGVTAGNHQEEDDVVL